MSDAIIYTRFSPRRNADNCESCETQADLCTAYCIQHGYHVTGTYEDRGRSGDEEDRPGLWAAIDALPRGGVLVAYKPDRLARSVYLSECIRRAVERRRGRVETVSGGTNGETDEEVLMRQILQAFAEYEKKVIAARTRAAMRRHQAAGRRMSSNPPYGHAIDPHDATRLVEDPDEQDTIARILRLAADGHGPGTIARMFNQSGIRARGAAWNHKTVGRIIERENA